MGHLSQVQTTHPSTLGQRMFWSMYVQVESRCAVRHSDDEDLRRGQHGGLIFSLPVSPPGSPHGSQIPAVIELDDFRGSAAEISPLSEGTRSRRNVAYFLCKLASTAFNIR